MWRKINNKNYSQFAHRFLCFSFFLLVSFFLACFFCLISSVLILKHCFALFKHGIFEHSYFSGKININKHTRNKNSNSYLPKKLTDPNNNYYETRGVTSPYRINILQKYTVAVNWSKHYGKSSVKCW